MSTGKTSSAPSAPDLPPTGLRELPGWVGPLAAVLLLVLTLGAMHALTREISYQEVLDGIRTTAWSGILLALLATVVSHVALIGYDLSAVRWVGASVRPGMVAATSFISFALGNAIGLGVLTGGAVRMRLYAAERVEPAQIAVIIAFCAASFGLGVTVVAAGGLVWGAQQVAAVAHVPASLLRVIGLSGLAVGVLLLFLSWRGKALRTPGGWTLRMPPLRIALAQLLLSAVDIVATGAVLWFLLPDSDLTFAPFIAMFSIALVLGVISHVPSGIGVFEAVMLLAVGHQVPASSLAGALILYRGIYFLLPLLVAILLLVLVELRRGVTGPARHALRSAQRVAPQFTAALTFIAGIGLLASGVTPASDFAVQALSAHVPLALVEASHFIASVLGLLLLLSANGLLHRLDGAWWAATLITGVATLLSLPKGIAVREMLLLGLLTVTLLASRPVFNRRSSLFGQTLTWRWWMAMAAIVASTIWLLFFAYRDVGYNDDLWWRFAFDAHAPRAMRASLAVSLATLALGFWLLLRKDPGQRHTPDRAQLEQAAQIFAQQPTAPAALALLGDKSLLFSSSGRSFVMYGRSGNSWVALFDPVGPAHERAGLIWNFIEMADRHGGRAAFYQVRPDTLPLYLDAGLRVYKLGEYASVPLAGFSLAGTPRAKVRQSVNRLEREGARFEMRSPEQVAELLPQLRQVSDAWLALHRTREKCFSMGSFQTDYLCRFPLALVWKDERLLAFASLMVSSQHEEATVDLMRYSREAPKGTMDFLFARVMGWCSDQGYARFGLGMAPMSGMAEHRLAPRWQRMGRLLFTHGERLYNFQGLRSFKEKFAPEWEPRYLAAPGGLAPLFVLTDAATLIAGGLRGVVTR